MDSNDLPHIDTSRRTTARLTKTRPRRRLVVNVAAGLGTLLLVAVSCFAVLFGIGFSMRSAAKRFHNQMIVDAFEQYKIVEKGDDLMAKSIHAAVVADAFLMAKDSDNYHKWKGISEKWDALSKQQIEAETKAMINRFSR